MNDIGNSRGVTSNTPLTDTLNSLVVEHVLPKRVLFDYVSATFDFIDVFCERPNNFYYLDPDNKNLRKLLSLFNFHGEIHELTKKNGFNGYKHCLIVGEHIKLYYGSERTKRNDKYTMNLVMSGEACREFENFMQGNWYRLLNFLISFTTTEFKRIDIAIDDFGANEIDIYEIKHFIDTDSYVSPMQSVKLIYSLKSGVSTGYSITFGSPKSNQLQIYDKKLERRNNKKIDLDTNIWYRYEMRFTDIKAEQVVVQYLTAVKNNNSFEFMQLARGLLFMMLDLKVEDPNDLNKSRWETYPRWINFLDSVEKIDLRTKHKINTTLQTTKEWIEKSATKAIIELYLAFKKKKISFKKYLDELIIENKEKLDSQSLAKINNWLQSEGAKEYTLDEALAEIYDLADDNKDLPF